jgi:hypothetical protein
MRILALLNDALAKNLVSTEAIRKKLLRIEHSGI